jgi:hypothetical protein
MILKSALVLKTAAMASIIGFSILLAGTDAAANAGEEYRLATGQGIVAPSLGSLYLYSRGYTGENPAGLMLENGIGVSLMNSKDTVSNTGYEALYANESWGLGFGSYLRGCVDCEADSTMGLGFGIGSNAAIGVRRTVYADVPTIGLGLMYGTKGPHQLGLVYDMVDPAGSNNNTSNIGFGYAYVTKDQTIALESSEQKFENTATVNDIKIVSLSYQKRQGSLSASMTYELRQNDPAENKDEFWMGVGFNSANWHLGVYAEYHQEMTLILSAHY